MKWPEDFINRIICGDHLIAIKDILNDVIDLTVTSPPYEELRDYRGFIFDHKKLIKELFRITKIGGVVVWVVGDQTIDGSESGNSFRQALYAKEIGFNLHDTMIYEKNNCRYPAGKRSVRYSNFFEYMFVFSKEKPKTINLIKDRKNRWAGTKGFGLQSFRQKNGSLSRENHNGISRKKRTDFYGCRSNIWRMNTGYGYSTKDKIAFEHPAIFPEQLAQDHIISWSGKNDIVLDPMCGSGTTCKMAKKLGRRFIGIDVGPEYCEIAGKRVSAIPELLF